MTDPDLAGLRLSARGAISACRKGILAVSFVDEFFNGR
jgi:hypothetical protein